MDGETCIDTRIYANVHTHNIARVRFAVPVNLCEFAFLISLGATFMHFSDATRTPAGESALIETAAV